MLDILIAIFTITGPIIPLIKWMTQIRSKRWTWTLLNYTDEEVEELKATVKTGFSTYIIFGIEICPTTGTPHLQGYMETSKRHTPQAMKKFNKRIHWEVTKKSTESNEIYCSKDGKVYEDGKQMEQGKRSDLKELSKRMREGANLRDLWNEFPKTMIRYHRGVQTGLNYLSPAFLPQQPRFTVEDFPSNKLDTSTIKSLIIWGGAGEGKTSYAKALFPTGLLISHMDQLRTFDKTIHEALIFDDMDFKHLPRTAQIHLTDWDEDRYIHIRYDIAYIPKHTKKIFTTNELNGFIFTVDAAIERRISRHHFINK